MSADRPDAETIAAAATSAAAAARRTELTGILLAVLTVSIWGFWIVGTRYTVTRDLEPHDLALLRFLPTAVILAPFWLRVGLVPRGVPLRVTVSLVLGGGVGFFMSASTGFLFAPASHAAAIMPSMMALFTALIGYFVFREQLSRGRWAGFVLIAAGSLGIGALAALTGGSGEWRGHILFLAAALSWAIYTHAFKRSGIPALASVGLFSVWTVIILVPVYLYKGSTGFDTAPWSTLIMQFALQGIISGVIALSAYSGAVTRLGTSRTAAFAALVPVIATLLGIPLLGEIPDAGTIVWGLIICLGVVLASGVTARSLGWRAG